MNHLVIGKGQVGTAIKNILNCDWKDQEELEGTYEVLHICFSYSDTFVKEVLDYKKKYGSSLVIIHSTVPVGTSRLCGAVHSPIRGVHPHLEQSIRIFVKYFGGQDETKTLVASSIFSYHGIPIEILKNSETTELLKLTDTTTYGLNILIAKETKALCDKYGTSYEETYTKANDTYNLGYLKLNMPQFHKYNIKDMKGKIGGHCIIPNSLLLDTWLNDILREKNELYEK